MSAEVLALSVWAEPAAPPNCQCQVRSDCGLALPTIRSDSERHGVLLGSPASVLVSGATLRLALGEAVRGLLGAARRRLAGRLHGELHRLVDRLVGLPVPDTAARAGGTTMRIKGRRCPPHHWAASLAPWSSHPCRVGIGMQRPITEICSFRWRAEGRTRTPGPNARASPCRGASRSRLTGVTESKPRG